jgi:hypothetical protein
MGITKNTSGARLVIKTDLDFNDVSIASVKINYIKPDGSKGEWTASILTGSESEGKIYVAFSNTVKLDQFGIWFFAPVITFSDGRIAYGVKVNYTVTDSIYTT